VDLQPNPVTKAMPKLIPVPSGSDDLASGSVDLRCGHPRRQGVSSGTLGIDNKTIDLALPRFRVASDDGAGHVGVVPANPSAEVHLDEVSGLDPTTLPDLGLSERRIPSGSRLLSAGDAGEEAYVVAEGRLRVSVRIPGVGEEALAFLGPGEVVGEMALVDDSPRSADVVAQDGQVTVFALPREVFRRLLNEGTPEGAPLLGGIVVALVRRFEESVQKAATFRVLAGPF